MLFVPVVSYETRYTRHTANVHAFERVGKCVLFTKRLSARVFVRDGDEGIIATTVNRAEECC